MASGRISRAFASTRWSLRSLYPESPAKHSITRLEKLTHWERRLHLTRQNTKILIRKKLIVLHQCGSQSWFMAIIPSCEEDIKEYILYERKNHPAKKGKGRKYTNYNELDAHNAILYPNGLNLYPP